MFCDEFSYLSCWTQHEQVACTIHLKLLSLLFELKTIKIKWRAKHRTYMLRWRGYCAEVIGQNTDPTTATRQSLLPAAAERLIELHQREAFIELRLNEIEFRGEVVRLIGQHL